MSYFIREYDLSGTVVAFNYRGYGRSAGNPNEANLFADSLFLYDTLVASGVLIPEKTVLIGRSIGTGIASYLSSKRFSQALILITPYDSILSISRESFPYVPVAWLSRNRFESTKYVERYMKPVFIIMAV
jgi:pimeloyl-ACP methyl ester carboxylesterase